MGLRCPIELFKQFSVMALKHRNYFDISMRFVKFFHQRFKRCSVFSSHCMPKFQSLFFLRNIRRLARLHIRRTRAGRFGFLFTRTSGDYNTY